jgi:hypothetical protein
MMWRDAAFLRHQQSRWLRQDAGRWVKADAARYLRPGSSLDALFGVEQKYNPNQPRVPAGSSDGGQWTNGASGSAQNDAAQSSGNIDLGNLPSFSDLFDTTDDIQLAGDPPGIGHNGGPSRGLVK